MVRVVPLPSRPIAKELKDAIVAQLEDRIDPSKFRKSWFRLDAQTPDDAPYVFVFRKNYSITNIQIQELLALLKLHVGRPTSAPFTFSSTGEFDAEFRSVMSDYRGVALPKKDLAGKIVDLKAHFLANTILVDEQFGTATVALPPGYSLDLESLVAESGYIHSAGRSIYVRRMPVAKRSDLVRNLKRYVSHLPDETEVDFVVYSNDDFTRHDRDFADALSGGLDSLKLHVTKAWIEDERLVSALAMTERDGIDGVRFVGPSDYEQRRRQRQIGNSPRGTAPSTIWLIGDRGTADGLPRHSNDMRYYLCYHQTVVNESPLAGIFEENKPAWRAHTTLPHSMAAALLNMARASAVQTTAAALTELRVVDPFGGSGTVLLECAKLGWTSQRGGDIDPLMAQIWIDNLAILSMDSNEVRNLGESLVSRSAGDDLRPDDATYNEALKRLADCAHESVAIDDDGDETFLDLAIPTSVTDALVSSSLEVRLAFYTALRAWQRHLPNLQRQGSHGELLDALERHSGWAAAFSAEGTQVARDLERLAELRARQETSSRELREKFRYVAADDTYSVGVGPGTREFKNEALGSGFKDSSATEWDWSEFDLLITDPPYGFNDERESLELSELVTTVLTAASKEMPQGAQIVVTLPDASFTGRAIPAFITADAIRKTIVAAAKSEGRRVVFPRRGIQGGSQASDADLYWEATRALRRRVVHALLL